jgi:hypothetical protein
MSSVRLRLQRWWDRLLGRPPWYRDTNVTVSRTDLYSEVVRREPKPSGPGELTLADEAGAAERRRQKRTAGIDPYANDAGFAKPPEDRG